jgi:hypothetical protein
VSLGEAWARAVSPDAISDPRALFGRLSLESEAQLTSPCPKATRPQCWEPRSEAFQADIEAVKRIRRHLTRLTERGIEILDVKTQVLCTKRLNDERKSGKNRFVSDLHAMERLILHFRERAGEDVHAVCGKVGGMAEYPKFFGPLQGRLHVVLDEGRPLSSYRMPGIGQIDFVRDADATHALVMLASLVGKYVRELLMGRISQFYSVLDGERPLDASGYNDPITKRFIELSAPKRKKLKISSSCFERVRDAIPR